MVFKTLSPAEMVKFEYVCHQRGMLKNAELDLEHGKFADASYLPFFTRRSWPKTFRQLLLLVGLLSLTYLVFKAPLSEKVKLSGVVVFGVAALVMLMRIAARDYARSRRECLDALESALGKTRWNEILRQFDRIRHSDHLPLSLEYL